MKGSAFMKLGIMQPYFLPYLGYWQLMNAVDTYVVYDDVNYIKGGYINRNSILINNEAKNINLILSGATPTKHINEIFVNESLVQKRKILSKIQMAYAKAPNYGSVYQVLEKVFLQQEINLAKYLYNSFKIVSEYLNINTKILLSSELKKDCSLKGKDKVISICKLLEADEYYNSVGGMELYDKDEFAENGIKLSFLKMDNDIVYKQFNNEFVPNLSIIDIMMFNSKNECKRLLEKYTLL